MKILIAPDKFRESLSSIEAAKSIEKGIKKVNKNIETVLCPIADCGEGTVDALVAATSGRHVICDATGPLGEKISAKYGILGDNKTAVVEMAAASGLLLVPKSKRNPLYTTTYGTGDMIKSALDFGAGKVIVGIGGSSTTDGGMGMAQALGIKFYDKEGNELGYGGVQLEKLFRIDIKNRDPRVADTIFEIACDVDNPLTGLKGAAYVYSPQKGAKPDEVKRLDEGLKNFTKVIKKGLGKDIENLKGAGAAGGLGAGLVAFLDAKLRPGIDIVIDTINLRKRMENVDLAITGEGSTDAQTLMGKAPTGVIGVAKELKIPVVIISGSVADDRSKLHESGVDAIFSIIPRPISLNKSLKNASLFLEKAAEEVIRLFITAKEKYS